MTHISIIPYEAQYQPDFKRLNLEWISRYFRVEPHDEEQLDHPEIHVLPNQGQIFLAKRNSAGEGESTGEIVGCVAMINMGDSGFELAKMAVSPTAQGQGVGRLLGQAAIDYGRQLGIKTVWLESNRRLTPAITLYKKLGFNEVPLVPTPYARADIRMEINL